MAEAAAQSESKAQASDETTITKLAEQTQAETDVVRTLYKEETEATQRGEGKGFHWHHCGATSQTAVAFRCKTSQTAVASR